VGSGTGTGGIDTITDFRGHASEGDRIDLRSLTNLTSFSQITNHAVQNGADTVITFGQDNTTQLVLKGIDKTTLTASDFILANAPISSPPNPDIPVPSVAVTVQTPDGYDFSNLYGDLAASYAGLANGSFAASNTDTHMFLVDAAKGITFEMIGTGFAYNGAHLPTGGTITEIDILDTVRPDDPTQLTQGHVLVNSNGWSVGASSLVGYLGFYNSQNLDQHSSGLSGLNGIFGAPTYNYVGSAGFADNNSNPHDGADVFVGGNHADVFNGLGGPFGSQDPGSDTVDYSHAPGIAGGPAGITVDLLHPENNTGAAQGDIFISIENLRGTNFNDTLRGDGNNNVIEGGLGNDVLDGGGNGIGTDIASYEHATGSVTVDLRIVGQQQDTGSAGLDTLSNFEGVRGSAFDDTLIGNGNSILEGGGGNDHLVGKVEGHDTASYEHATAAVTVDLNRQGGDVQNTHGAGLDTLTNIANVSGSQFNDTLIGDSHDNIFFGNGGHDTFVFGSTTGHDIIGDFSSGDDKIDVGYTVSDPTNSAAFDRWLISVAQTVGNDTLIDLDPDPNLLHPGPNTLLLKNVYMGNLQASDFVFHGSGNVL
jgi:Ca2+-binding RTX toxin-like protein